MNIFAQDPIGRAELREIKAKLEIAWGRECAQLDETDASPFIRLCARMVTTIEHEREYVPTAYVTEEARNETPHPQPFGVTRPVI